MSNVLILYATTEGQTAKISNHLADTIRAKGFTVELVDVKNLPFNFSLEKYQAAILGGSIHNAKHQAYLVSFIKSNLAALRKRQWGVRNIRTKMGHNN